MPGTCLTNRNNSRHVLYPETQLQKHARKEPQPLAQDQGSRSCFPVGVDCLYNKKQGMAL